MMTHLVPLNEATKIVEQFDAATLPSWAWTHEAHLMAGLYILSRFGAEAAPQEMKKRILRYNEAVGKVNSDTSGYHETLTFFWLNAIQKQLAPDGSPLNFDQATLDELLFDVDLANRNLFLKTYSEARILSVEARRQFVEPDL